MKKKTSKKVKQVAARAKAPRPAGKLATRQELNTGKHGLDAAVPVPPAPVTVVDGGVEFNVGEPFGELKNKALDRATRVDLKESIKGVIASFAERINTRLGDMSKQVEAQLAPLARTIADIAVAKKELSLELEDFGNELSAVLNLNDELDPIDIETMFASHYDLEDDIMVSVSAKPANVLDEAVDDARKEANDAQLAGHAIEAYDPDSPVN